MIVEKLVDIKLALKKVVPAIPYDETTSKSLATQDLKLRTFKLKMDKIVSLFSFKFTIYSKQLNIH